MQGGLNTSVLSIVVEMGCRGGRGRALHAGGQPSLQVSHEGGGLLLLLLHWLSHLPRLPWLLGRKRTTDECLLRQQGHKDIYLPVTFKCTQEFVLVTFHSYDALTNRQNTISHV